MSKANQEAKKERHEKLFEGQYHTNIGKLWFKIRRVSKAVFHALRPSRKRLSRFMHPLDHMPAPKRLYTQLSLWSIALLVITSINTQAAYGWGENVGTVYEDLALDLSESYITDEEGFLIKSMPLDGEAVYDQNRSTMVQHEIQPGETISEIAYRYGIRVSSISYANVGININRIKPGQELNIPPQDGLYVTVESGDSLVSLVEDYDGNVDTTKEFNQLEGEGSLVADTELFIVDGSPQNVYVPPVIATALSTPSASTASSASSGTAPAPSVSQYNLPASSSGWIRPTQGIITQGYHGGHLAYDVADRSKPPVLAAATGTVVKASSGTWGGGYGNHIIIDHGNGYKTLYAHNEVLYVGVGDTVAQGQVIAKMGNTGRVYGATGIHLHFEISYNGVKQSPSIMGVW